MKENFEKDLYSFIGKRVREIRSARQLTQAELASDLKMTRTSITNLERGNQRIPLHVLMRIAELLKCELRDFLPLREDISGESKTSVFSDRLKIQGELSPLAAKFIIERAKGRPQEDGNPTSKKASTKLSE